MFGNACQNFAETQRGVVLEGGMRAQYFFQQPGNLFSFSIFTQVVALARVFNYMHVFPCSLSERITYTMMLGEGVMNR
jgi:hypothetical protein